MTGEMPALPGLRVPDDLYCVLLAPAPLAGMTYPGATPWQALFGAGFRHVICLSENRPRYSPAPLSHAYAAALEDLHGGGWPEDPGREERLVRAAVSAAAARLAAGEGIVVHCVGGTGRTGAVLGCLLRLRGFAAAEVIAYLDALNLARGRPGWPESPWQAELVARWPGPRLTL